MEKPFTANTAQAEELIELAAKKKLHDHGGSHLFIHRRGAENPPAGGRRGDGQSLHRRLHAGESGTVQHDINVIWDSGADDLSIMDSSHPETAGGGGSHGIKASEQPRGDSGLPDPSIFPTAWWRTSTLKLALPGKVPHHADRRREKDAGVERVIEARRTIEVDDRGVTVRKWKQGVYHLLVSYRSGDSGRRGGVDEVLRREPAIVWSASLPDRVPSICHRSGRGCGWCACSKPPKNP